MRIRLDTARCQGHGRCYVLAPQLFDCDDEGSAILRGDGDVATSEHDAARLAAESCPELAITLE